MNTLALDAGTPQVDPTAYIAPGAWLIGDVRVHAEASVWFNAVLRADGNSITIGEGSNIQDLVACHVDPGFALTVGKGVSVGHSAVLHGCTIEDGSLIGMNATVLNGAVIGAGSLVAAGAVVLEGTVVPPRSLVAGVPAKVRRELSDDEAAGIALNGAVYVDRAAVMREV